MVLQPTALLLILVAAGAGVAETVGSQSLLVDVARGDPLQDGWSVPVLSFFAVGLFAGALLYVGDRRARPAWASEGDADLISQWKPRDVIPGVTYGGVTEEVMMRWGLMGVILWGLASLSSADDPANWAVTPAIVASAILFAAGHLPAAMLGGRRSGRFIIRILVLNTAAAGLLFGWLFWRWNLETAIAPHAGFHVGAAALVLAMRGRGVAA